MRQMRRLSLVFSLALILSVSAAAFVGAHHVPQVHAAPSVRQSAPCTGDGCNDIDPVQEGCTPPAYNLEYQPDPYGNWIELRRSDLCVADWGRASAVSGWMIVGVYLDWCFGGSGGLCQGGTVGHAYADIAVGQPNYCIGSGIAFCHWNSIGYGTTFWYTNMVDGSFPTRVYVVFYNPSMNFYEGVLSSFH